MSQHDPGTVLITGAGSERGIGRAAAESFARDGWTVAVMDRDEDGVRATAAALAAFGNDPDLWAAGDVSSEADVQRAVGALAARLPRIDALVNVAGITRPGGVLDTALEDWERVFSVNSTGTFLVTKAVLPTMIEHGYGRIVSISSVSGQRGGGIFGGAAYSASKAAVLGLTRALAREVAVHGITANAITPGLVDTDLAAPHLTPAQREAVLATIPAGRLATVADVVSAIRYACSEGTGYVTGATLDVNGGSHIY